MAWEIADQLVSKAKKKMCVSGRPTNPKILPPTQTFFMPNKKIDRQNPEIRLCFRLQKTIFFISLYIWSMFGTKNIVLHVK